MSRLERRDTGSRSMRLAEAYFVDEVRERQLLAKRPDIGSTPKLMTLSNAFRKMSDDLLKSNIMPITGKITKVSAGSRFYMRIAYKLCFAVSYVRI